MGDEPALDPRERLRQARLVNGLAWLLCLLWFQRHPIWQKTLNTQRRTPNIELQNLARQCELQCCTWFGVGCSALSVRRFLSELEQLQRLRRCVDDLSQRFAQTKRRARREIEIVVVENHMQISRFLCEFSAALR